MQIDIRKPMLHGLGCLALAALATTQVQASTSVLQDEMGEVAKNLATLPQLQREKSVAMGTFSGPSILRSGAGPGIAKALADALKIAGIKVSRRASLEIKGDFFVNRDRQTKEIVARIKGRVIDALTGDIVTEFERQISSQMGEADLAALLGLTIQPPADSVHPGPKKDDDIWDSIRDPKAFIRGSKIYAGPNGRFGIEILTRRGRQLVRRQAKNDDGFAVTPVKRGETYVVRLINNSPKEVAVMLSIDGLNVFTFSEVMNPLTGLHKYSRYIVKPGKTVTVRGWHVNNRQVDSFLVTGYAESARAAASLPVSEEVGTITAAFLESREVKQVFAKQVFGASDPNATGRGKREEQVTTEIKNRMYGPMLASVTVRYNK